MLLRVDGNDKVYNSFDYLYREGHETTESVHRLGSWTVDRLSCFVRACNQMCVNFIAVPQARPHKSVNTQLLVPREGRSSVNPDRIPPLGVSSCSDSKCLCGSSPCLMVYVRCMDCGIGALRAAAAEEARAILWRTVHTCVLSVKTM